MKMEIEIISKELIKPSSPTPSHLRHLQLSFLDQMAPHVFVPFVHFYSKSNTINNIQQRNLLKKSLSEVLTIFYPVAGRVRNNSYIDCNDEGVLYVEAKLNCQISDILRDRNPSNNNYLVPLGPSGKGDLVCFLQITIFNCGGLAVSIGLSHKLADALSIFMFMNTWAAIARGETNIIIPFFGHSTLFPPANITGFESSSLINSKEKITTKSFLFDSSAIAALRAKYTAADGSRPPSRVEALVAFILSRFMSNIKGKSIVNTPYRVMQPVNLRQRMEQPPRQSHKRMFGNLVSAALAEARIESENDECHGILKKMRDSTRNVNAEYVRKLQSKDGLLNFLRSIEEYNTSEEEVVSFTISSMQHFQAYETDFGWGKPLWVGLTPMFFKNQVILFGTNDGKGIEVWICLKEEDMAKFEIDNQILAYVSSTPKQNLNAHSRF